MKTVFLSELSPHGLSGPVRDTLRDHAIYTMGDLATAMFEKRLGTMLEDEERIAVIDAVWSWIHATFPKGRAAPGPTAGDGEGP